MTKFVQRLMMGSAALGLLASCATTSVQTSDLHLRHANAVTQLGDSGPAALLSNFRVTNSDPSAVPQLVHSDPAQTIVDKHATDISVPAHTFHARFENGDATSPIFKTQSEQEIFDRAFTTELVNGKTAVVHLESGLTCLEEMLSADATRAPLKLDTVHVFDKQLARDVGCHYKAEGRNDRLTLFSTYAPEVTQAAHFNSALAGFSKALGVTQARGVAVLNLKAASGFFDDAFNDPDLKERFYTGLENTFAAGFDVTAQNGNSSTINISLVG